MVSIKHKFDSGVKWCSPSGTCHREGGPAIECDDGRNFWMINGRSHRLDGPAVEFKGKAISWWINGHQVDDKIRPWAKNFNIDLDNLTDEDKQMILLYWGDYGK